MTAPSSKRRNDNSASRTTDRPARSDEGLISLRSATILGGAGAVAWLGYAEPVAGGAVATAVAMAYLLNRLLHR